MCLKITSENNGTTKFFGLYLMKGPHDHELERSGRWPLRGIFTVDILNKTGYLVQLLFSPQSCSECSDRVVDGSIATEGWNYFLRENTVHSMCNNVTCYFKVAYDDNPPHITTLPNTITVSKFTVKMKNKEPFSYLYFTSDEGYLMMLRVYANGVGSGEGTHVSVFLYIS